MAAGSHTSDAEGPPLAEPRPAVLPEGTAAGPADLTDLVTSLARRGSAALRSVPGEELRSAWNLTIDEFLDPGSPQRRDLNAAWGTAAGLTPSGLDAAVEAVLRGVRGDAATALWRQAAGRRTPDGVVAVLLAGNLPALAVQPLLPALALRRPVLLKPAAADPGFTAAFVRRLGQRIPACTAGLAVLPWRGGDGWIEDELLPACERVLAYGTAETLADLATRPGVRLLPFGPRWSAAALGEEVAVEDVAAGLARDIALFDQRGCLSVQAVWTAGPPEALARALAVALEHQAALWPPGPVPRTEAAAVQQWRLDARARGLFCLELPLAVGTVIVEPRPEPRPGPGLRTVRIHPLPKLDRLPDLLRPRAGSFQGFALAGAAARALEPALETLGVSRCAAPGALQDADALWHNGGRHPLETLGALPPRAGSGEAAS